MVAVYSYASTLKGIKWSVKADGYRTATIKFAGRFHTISRHVLVLFKETGKLFDNVDHINNIPGDDRPENLRGSTVCQNQYNSKLRTDNKSGVKGVSWNRSRGKWRAQIRFEGRNINLGSFDNIEDAKQTVESARARLHKEFANNGF